MSDTYHGIPEKMVPVLPGHDPDGKREGRKGPVKVDATEVDALSSAKVGEDDITNEGVSKDDEEEHDHEWC